MIPNVMLTGEQLHRLTAERREHLASQWGGPRRWGRARETEPEVPAVRDRTARPPSQREPRPGPDGLATGQDVLVGGGC